MAWHIMGALRSEKYDKKYSEKEISKRLAPYMLKYKKLLALITIFSLLGALTSIIAPLVMGIGFDELFKGVESQSLDLIILISITYFLLLTFEWIFNYFSQINSSILQANVTYDLRRKLFERINQHELAFFDANKTGKIMSRVSGDTFQLGGVLTSIMDLGSVILRAGLILTTMFFLDWQLTLFSLLIFPFLFLIVFVFRRVFRQYSLLQMRAEATLNAFVEEQISGIQITKSFGQEQNVLQSFEELQNTKVKVNIKQATLFRAVGPLFDLIAAIGLTLILFGGGITITQTPSLLTPGLLYLFITYLRQLFQPLIALSTFYASLQGGFASGERIFSLMDVPVELNEGHLICPPLNGEIEFKDINFGYNLTTSVLKDFNLHIPSGQTLAIVGETGAGKSTITSLLARFYEYNSGEIILNGNLCLKDLDADSLRNQLGYVLQEPFLFSGTIRDNLLLGSPSATENDLQWAIKTVNADSFISMLPKGLDTPIKERGRGLSQGQKQLLSLARILLKDPKILLLDEATASVDAYTEHMIQKALEIVFKDRTTIVIAHRLSTILKADRIIVLDKGQIIDSGTHQELINKLGAYRDLYYTYYAHQGALEELKLKQKEIHVLVED
ncbi:ABC transporter ATP-binding protein [Candidatus Hodarchaeum mangrovi]